MPEQGWEDPDTPASPFGADPTTASIGFRNGKAAGSAAPLIWGQAQYLRLVLDLKAGTLIDQPQITRARYLDPSPPADVPVTIASPAKGATVTDTDENRSLLIAQAVGREFPTMVNRLDNAGLKKPSVALDVVSGVVAVLVFPSATELMLLLPPARPGRPVVAHFFCLLPAAWASD